MRVEWSLNALTDLEWIKEYIEADSEYYALKFVEGAFDTVLKLEDFPSIGRVVPEIGQNNIRELMYGNYRIIYSLEEKAAIILTVVHSMRNFTGFE